MASSAAILVMIICVYKLVDTYNTKSPWYSPNFYPPAYYTRGPLIRDQGSSF